MPDNEVLMIPLCEVDTDVIKKLDDEPNDVGGLTAAELKAAFDAAGDGLKDYLNETLIPQIIAADATEQARAGAESVRETQETQRQANEATRQSNESTRQTQEAAREAAEAARANENSGIVAQATAQADRAAQSATSAGQDATRAQQYAEEAAASEDHASRAADDAQQSLDLVQGYASNAERSEYYAGQSEFFAEESATLAQSYAKGGTGSRAGENTDNAKYYKEQSETIYNNVDRRFQTGLDNGLLCAKNISLTLTATGWSASEPYVQTVNAGADALAENQTGHAFLSNSATDAQYAEANRCGIRLQSATTSTVTFRAMFAKPTVDLPVTLELHFTPEALGAAFATQADLDNLTAEDVGAIPTTEKGAQNGVATLGSDGKIPGTQLPTMNFIAASQKGAANGVASLDGTGKVPKAQIPALDYVPKTRKVNGKALSADISLGAADVGARADNWTPGVSDLAQGFVLPLDKGGTGANTKAGAKAALEIPDLPVSVANGGTGATTAAGARENLGLGDYGTVKDAVTTLGQNVATLMQQSARVVQGYYVGDGTYGADHPNVLTFDFTPVLVLVYTKNSTGGPVSTHLMRGLDVAPQFRSGTFPVTWADKSVSWYAAGAEWQGNTNGQVYYYIAIGYEAEG